MEKQVMWAVYDRNGKVEMSTLAWLKRDAIAIFINGADITWAECKPYGWKVRKLEVTITPIV